MNSSIFERRRSERLAELLDDATGRRTRHRRTELDAELAELVRLTGRVASLPTSIDPDPDFRCGLRSMLIAKIERDGIGTTADAKAAQIASRAAIAGKTKAIRQVPTGHGRTRAAVLIGVTAGALALSGVSAASTDSLPGDPLYQVKRSSERAQLALAGSDLARGQLHFEFARSRLDEAMRVPADRVAGVLADMDQETRYGATLFINWATQRRDGTALEAVDRFVREQRGKLVKLPGDRTAGSLSLLSWIAEQSRTLRLSLQR